MQRCAAMAKTGCSPASMKLGAISEARCAGAAHSSTKSATGAEEKPDSSAPAPPTAAPCSLAAGSMASAPPDAGPTAACATPCHNQARSRPMDDAARGMWSLWILKTCVSESKPPSVHSTGAGSPNWCSPAPPDVRLALLAYDVDNMTVLKSRCRARGWVMRSRVVAADRSCRPPQHTSRPAHMVVAAFPRGKSHSDGCCGSDPGRARTSFRHSALQRGNSAACSSAPCCANCVHFGRGCAAARLAKLQCHMPEEAALPLACPPNTSRASFPGTRCTAACVRGVGGTPLLSTEDTSTRKRQDLLAPCGGGTK